MKCCDHSLNAALEGWHGPMDVGMTVACRECDGWWAYEEKGTARMWIRHDRVGDFVTREGDPIATEARWNAYERILHKPWER